MSTDIHISTIQDVPHDHANLILISNSERWWSLYDIRPLYPYKDMPDVARGTERVFIGYIWRESDGTFTIRTEYQPTTPFTNFTEAATHLYDEYTI